MSTTPVTRDWDFAALDAPPAELIEDLRRRFPTERETDAQLVRKLQRRGGPPFTPGPLQQLAGGLRAMLAERSGGRFEVLNARWFTGGSSKIQMGFDLRCENPSR